MEFTLRPKTYWVPAGAPGRPWLSRGVSVLSLAVLLLLVSWACVLVHTGSRAGEGPAPWASSAGLCYGGRVTRLILWPLLWP